MLQWPLSVVWINLGNIFYLFSIRRYQIFDNNLQFILFSAHAPVLETRLSFGASRYEASLPLAVESIRLAMIPVFTQLSVMGMINIPGMMVGQLVAGTPIMQAVIYQQCIMFMITASSMFGVIMSVAVSITIRKSNHMKNSLLT